jgi:hypothetical protein
MNLKAIDPILKKYSGIVNSYHDRYLVDSILTDIDVFLFTIFVIEESNKKAGVLYNYVRDVFSYLGRNEANLSKHVYYCKKNNLIEGDARSGVITLTINGLKKVREVLHQIEKQPVYLIKSGSSFTSIKLFEEFLCAEVTADQLLLCDSYISHITLFPFSVLNGKLKAISILTSKVHDEDKFKAYAEKMKKEMGIDVKYKINTKIHDRFIIVGDKAWSIGTSIKDFGNKDTMIKEVFEVTDSLKKLFIERWEE